MVSSIFKVRKVHYKRTGMKRFNFCVLFSDLMSKTEGVYRCHVCGKEMKFKQDMEKHIMVHTGEKPFMCKQCGKRFRQKVHLRSHIAIVHNMI